MMYSIRVRLKRAVHVFAIQGVRRLLVLDSDVGFHGLLETFRVVFRRDTGHLVPMNLGFSLEFEFLFVVEMGQRINDG